MIDRSRISICVIASFTVTLALVVARPVLGACSQGQVVTSVSPDCQSAPITDFIKVVEFETPAAGDAWTSSRTTTTCPSGTSPTTRIVPKPSGAIAWEPGNLPAVSDLWFMANIKEMTSAEGRCDISFWWYKRTKYNVGRGSPVGVNAKQIFGSGATCEDGIVSVPNPRNPNDANPAKPFAEAFRCLTVCWQAGL